VNWTVKGATPLVLSAEEEAVKGFPPPPVVTLIEIAAAFFVWPAESATVSTAE
jgi:hypothetical protein